LAIRNKTWQVLRDLSHGQEVWRREIDVRVRQELRRFLGQYVTYLLGHRPRLLPYLSTPSRPGTLLPSKEAFIGGESTMVNAKAPFLGRCACVTALGLALTATRCAGNWPWVKKSGDTPIDPMAFAMAQPDRDASPAKTSGDLAKAHELYQQGKFAEAEAKFTAIAENNKNSAAVCEEGRFYSAECLYRLNQYPGACDTYKKMLQDFPSGHYKDQAVQRVFDIANYWLKDTEREIKEYEEKVHAKLPFVMPAGLKVHVGDPAMPTLDTEGRAIKALEVVHYADITGPLADRALFLCGYIRFFREDYP